jgi:hypothetical protein
MENTQQRYIEQWKDRYYMEETPSWTVKRYGKYRRKVSWIVKWYGKYRRKLWNDIENTEEK